MATSVEEWPSTPYSIQYHLLGLQLLITQLAVINRSPCIFLYYILLADAILFSPTKITHESQLKTERENNINCLSKHSSLETLFLTGFY